MFLNKLELKELTGYSRPRSQMTWFSNNNYLFEVGADGYPRVLISLVEKRLGSHIAPTQKNNQPRFSTIR